MAQLELDTEREMLVPIKATLHMADKLHAEGHHILFISDMYLPDDFLRERLTAFGFYREGDGLYVSNTVGAWKGDGSLFRYVKEKEGISYRHWHHYGDNRHADYKVPRRLGIHAHHLHYDYLHYEKLWRKMAIVGYPVGSIAAGISRSARLQNNGIGSQQAFDADIAAPFITAWVMRVMSSAASRGIGRLYFCARDTHSEYLIAHTLQPLFPGIEVRYLFISRKALYESPMAISYLKSMGFADGVSSAIVDTCSSGKTFRHLRQILQEAKLPMVNGYFLNKLDVEKVFDPRSDYELCDAYLATADSPSCKNLICQYVFYELLFSLNHHHTTIGYEYHRDRIRPVLTEDPDHEWGFKGLDVRKAKRDHDTLLTSYAKAVMATGLYAWHDDIFCRIALPTFSSFIDYPNRECYEYLHHFQWWGKPLMGGLMGKNKGNWERGNQFYTLPHWLIKPYNKLLNKATRTKLVAPLAKKIKKLQRCCM